MRQIKAQPQRVISAEMPCPACGTMAKLSIQSFNRRVACSVCDVEFVATVGEPINLDVRFVPVFCVSENEAFTKIYERSGPGQLYRHVKTTKKAPRSNPGAATNPQKLSTNFDFAEFEPQWICPGCGHEGILLDDRDGMLFCRAGAVQNKNGCYAICPLCRSGDYYNEPITTIDGRDNKSLPSPGAEKNALPAPPRKLLNGGR
jgi:hypothetical protein